jgi:hypothetical protein
LKEVLLETTSGAKPRSREKVVDELFHLLETGYLRIDPTRPVKPWRPEDSATDTDTPLTMRTLAKPTQLRRVARKGTVRKKR